MNIGIAKIVIYDNNDINGEIINENIKTQYSKKVDIIDIRGMSSIQIPILRIKKILTINLIQMEKKYILKPF